MMTRMSAVAPKERISSGLSSVMRERSAAGPTRRDKLLGISPGSPSSSPSPLALDSDGELKEEDVWGGDENLGEDPDSSSDNQSQQQHSRLVKNGRQWLGLEKEASPLGLSSINRPSPNAGRDSAPVPVRKMATAARMIPHVSSGVFDHSSKMLQQHQSAPVNIPDWSKILGMDKRGSATNKENGFALDEGREEELEGDESDGGDEESSKIKKKKKNRLPPHELAAREYAKSHTAFSVYEGAGRTLKGMDLRRVRNAVWMQTGFMGG